MDLGIRRQSIGGNSYLMDDSNGSTSAKWKDRQLLDSSSGVSLDWNNRQLFASASDTIPVMDWENGYLGDINFANSVLLNHTSSDPCLDFRGSSVILYLKSFAPTMYNSTLAHSYNESTNTLTFTYKRSDGVVKTGTVACT